MSEQKQVGAGDSKAEEALRRMDLAFDRSADGEPETASLMAADAQVHASLAVADEIRQLRELLGSSYS